MGGGIDKCHYLDKIDLYVKHREVYDVINSGKH